MAAAAQQVLVLTARQVVKVALQLDLQLELLVQVRADQVAVLVADILQLQLVQPVQLALIHQLVPLRHLVTQVRQDLLLLELLRTVAVAAASFLLSLELVLL